MMRSSGQSWLIDTSALRKNDTSTPYQYSNISDFLEKDIIWFVNQRGDTGSGLCEAGEPSANSNSTDFFLSTEILRD